jgi:hypothetical protein
MPIAYDKCNGLRLLCQKEEGNRAGLIKIDGMWLQALKDNVNNILG